MLALSTGFRGIERGKVVFTRQGKGERERGKEIGEVVAKALLNTMLRRIVYNYRTINTVATELPRQ